MTHCRDMTTPELIRALTDSKLNRIHPRYRLELIYDLVGRLEQEYQRAEEHRERLGHFQHCLNTNIPGPGYIKVVKPHISICSSSGYGWPAGRPIWRCTGPFGTVQFGSGPGEAYAAWRRVMERGQVGRS